MFPTIRCQNQLPNEFHQPESLCRVAPSLVPRSLIKNQRSLDYLLVTWYVNKYVVNCLLIENLLKRTVMISNQLILLCIIWTVAKACENPALKNGTESNSTTTESSRQKRSCLGVVGSDSSCKYCEGTLTFIPNIQGGRKLFE